MGAIVHWNKYLSIKVGTSNNHRVLWLRSPDGNLYLKCRIIVPQVAPKPLEIPSPLHLNNAGARSPQSRAYTNQHRGW